MSKFSTKAECLIQLAKKQPVLCAKQLREAGIGSATIAAAVEAGTIEHVSRGIYRHVDTEWDENEHLSEVLARVPQAVVVLLSALNFHGIGTHQAHAVYLLLKQNAVKPRISYPPIEIVKSTIPGAFTEGVSSHRLNGIDVPITDPARTVADCFKHRSKLGLELCL
ncbi:MAG: transcriptional regulator, partial [Verrucomicrobia bacterium]|nr:transcriptional regulator [Verrucomicrobiota bacterium]